MPDSVESQRPPEHPLKVLRTITGTSQRKFAEAIGFTWNTLRSIEINRRPLTPEGLVQIQISIGAIWDPHNRQWYFDPGGFAGRRMPYLREHFQTFCQELRSEARERAMIVYYLTLRFHHFCTAIPSAAFNGWFWRVVLKFDKWAEQFNLKDDFVILFEPRWDSERLRTIGYRKIFPYLLTGEEKVFADMIEKARKEKQQTLEELFPPKVIAKSEFIRSSQKKTKPHSRRLRAEK